MKNPFWTSFVKEQLPFITCNQTMCLTLVMLYNKKLTGIGDSIICSNIQVCQRLANLPYRWQSMKIAGQHLITAVFEQDFGFNTTTWNLGSDTSFVELDTSNVTPDQLQKAERNINKFIAEQTNVSVVRVSGDETEIPPEVNLCWIMLDSLFYKIIPLNR